MFYDEEKRKIDKKGEECLCGQGYKERKLKKRQWLKDEAEEKDLLRGLRMRRRRKRWLMRKMGCKDEDAGKKTEIETRFKYEAERKTEEKERGLRKRMRREMVNEEEGV